ARRRVARHRAQLPRHGPGAGLDRSGRRARLAAAAGVPRRADAVDGPRVPLDAHAGVRGLGRGRGRTRLIEGAVGRLDGRLVIRYLCTWTWLSQVSGLPAR